MMRTVFWTSALALGAGACTPAPSGNAHWGAACAHLTALHEGDDVPWDGDGCLESFAALPRVVADDVARCLRQRTDVSTEDDHCWRKRTRDYFSRIDQAQTQLERLQRAIYRHVDETRALPTSLAKINGGTEPRDPWDRGYRLTPLVESRFELRSAGPDRTYDTDDDIVAPEFIYFKF